MPTGEARHGRDAGPPRSYIPAMSSDVSLEVGLRRASGTLEALLERARDARLLDVTDAPGGSAALWLSRLQAAREQPLLVITADAESARQCAQELAFFLGEAEADQVLRYPEIGRAHV